MKLKALKKKIRRLEIRLQEGPKKLARLKGKLAAQVAKTAAKAKRKSAARSVAGTSTSTRRETHPLSGKKPGAPKKAKRKLNLSPERRAQLAAAMKARWAAKRAAAAETNPESTSTSHDFTLGQTPQPT